MNAVTGVQRTISAASLRAEEAAQSDRVFRVPVFPPGTLWAVLWHPFSVLTSCPAVSDGPFLKLPHLPCNSLTCNLLGTVTLHALFIKSVLMSIKINTPFFI